MRPLARRRARRSPRLFPGLAIACLLVSPTALASGGSPGVSQPPASPAAHSLATLGDDLGLTRAEVEALETGQPVVHRPDAEAPPASAAGLAYRVLAAPADRVFRAVADWTHYAEFFPFVLQSRVLTWTGGEARAPLDHLAEQRVEQRVDLPFPFPDRRFALRTGWRCCTPGTRGDGQPTYEITWGYVEGSGNIAAQEGRWRLWPLTTGGSRTLVELRLASDAGTGIPDGLERRALLETLPWALDGLRQQVRRCRYDLPIHPTCQELPPHPAPGLRPGPGHPAHALPEGGR